MSIASEINRINTNIANAYSKIEEKGGTLPQEQNSSNLASAVNSISGSTGGRDWTQLGYEEEPKSIDEGFEYAKNIKQNWDTSVTNLYRKYLNDKNLMYFPNVDMSNVTKANNMFEGCVKLEFFDVINPRYNCNMQGMFKIGNNVNTKLIGNKIYITDNMNNTSIFDNISILELGEVVFNNSPNRGQNIFNSINDLRIKKITNNYTSREKGILFNCTMDDDTIKVFLNYFKTLTSQKSSYKTLKAMGFTNSNCNQAVLLDEWQDLVEAGWTTGY